MGVRLFNGEFKESEFQRVDGTSIVGEANCTKIDEDFVGEIRSLDIFSYGGAEALQLWNDYYGHYRWDYHWDPDRSNLEYATFYKSTNCTGQPLVVKINDDYSPFTPDHDQMDRWGWNNSAQSV